MKVMRLVPDRHRVGALGKIDDVAVMLVYLVVLVLVAIVLFAAASLLFGRGEQLPPLPRATTATTLPAFRVTRADVDAVKFTQVLRGYSDQRGGLGAGTASAVPRLRLSSGAIHASSEDAEAESDALNLRAARLSCTTVLTFA